MNEQQSADQVWAIELHGIEPISDQDRHGRPFELFWVWFAANIGILGIVYGAILTAFGLNLWQSALVALAGSAGSFLLVGVLERGRQVGWRAQPDALASSLRRTRQPGTHAAQLDQPRRLGDDQRHHRDLCAAWPTRSLRPAAQILSGPLSASSLIALLVVAAGLLGHATLVWIRASGHLDLRPAYAGDSDLSD